MKRKEELFMFEENEMNNGFKKILEELKEELINYNFDNEIPYITHVGLITLATSICLITDNESSKETKIKEFLRAIRSIEETKNELFLLMMDLGIKDIFDFYNNGNDFAIKEEYIEMMDKLD